MTRRKFTSIPLEISTIKEDGYHIFVNISIKDIPVRMLLDTGASRTVFDTDSIKKTVNGIEMEENEDKATGLGTNTVENFVAIIDYFKIGDLELNDLQVGVMDLKHVNISYNNIHILPVGGVLGSDLLVRYNGIIDLKKRELLLEID